MLMYVGKMSIICIYELISKTTGKIYVGQTKNFGHRMSDYRKYFSSTYNYAPKWIKKYLLEHSVKSFEEEFDIHVLEVLNSIDELNDREIYWIAKLNSIDPEVGYNSKPGGAPLSQSTKNIYRYVLENGSKRHIESVYCYDLNADTVDRYFSSKSCADDLHISSESISSIIKRGCVLNHSYIIFYTNKNKRKRIAHNFADEYLKKIIEYSDMAKNDPVLQTQVSHLVNRLVNYMEAYVNVDLYDTYFNNLDSGDTRAFPSETDETIYAYKICAVAMTYKLQSRRKRRAIKKKEYLAYCKNNNVPITDPNFKVHGKMCPVILYDTEREQVLAYVDKLSAAKSIGVTSDCVRSKIESGAKILNRYFIYYADSIKRYNTLIINMHKVKRDPLKRSEKFQYVKGFFMCERLCANNTFNSSGYTI